MDPDDPGGAESSFARARHSELDGYRSALVEAAADITRQAQQLQARQGDPRDPWILRMVLTEACRGTPHEAQVGRADLDTENPGAEACWIAS
eukprot:9899214-Lingulodinium_polyedra.AAC.1